MSVYIQDPSCIAFKTGMASLGLQLSDPEKAVKGVKLVARQGEALGRDRH